MEQPIITIPQISVTPTQLTAPILVGSTITLSATITNQQSTGYEPFLQIYMPTSCYSFLGASSSLGSVSGVSSFVIATCANDPVISQV